MDAWMIWAIAVFVLAVLEIFTPGFFVLCLSFGALCAVLAAALGFGLAGQLAFFAVGSTLAFIFVRPVMVKYFLKKDPVKTGIEALVGRTGRVTEPIDPLLHRGRVAVDGDDWKAVCVDGVPVAQGETVEIIRVDSTILYVKKIEMSN